MEHSLQGSIKEVKKEVEHVKAFTATVSQRITELADDVQVEMFI